MDRNSFCKCGFSLHGIGCASTPQINQWHYPQGVECTIWQKLFLIKNHCSTTHVSITSVGDHSVKCHSMAPVQVPLAKNRNLTHFTNWSHLAKWPCVTWTSVNLHFVKCSLDGTYPSNFPDWLQEVSSSSSRDWEHQVWATLVTRVYLEAQHQLAVPFWSVARGRAYILWHKSKWWYRQTKGSGTISKGNV